MVLQGAVLPDHAPVNNYELSIIGGPAIFFTEVSGIEVETQSTDLPDRTKASGGNVTPQEWTAKQMLHHTVEKAYLEEWLQEGKDPVQATYKREATLIFKTISGAITATYQLKGVWIMKRALPDLAKENEGEAAQIEWTFSSDNVVPI